MSERPNEEALIAEACAVTVEIGYPLLHDGRHVRPPAVSEANRAQPRVPAASRGIRQANPNTAS